MSNSFADKKGSEHTFIGRKRHFWCRDMEYLRSFENRQYWGF